MLNLSRPIPALALAGALVFAGAACDSPTSPDESAEIEGDVTGEDQVEQEQEQDLGQDEG